MVKRLILLAFLFISIGVNAQIKQIDYLVYTIEADAIVVVPIGVFQGQALFIPTFNEADKKTVLDARIVCQTFIDTLENKEILYVTYFTATNTVSVQNKDNKVISAELRAYGAMYPDKKAKIDALGALCTRKINE